VVEADVRPERLSDHPWRQTIANEVHARPVELVPAAGRVHRVGMLLPHQHDALKAAQEAFTNWCARTGIPLPGGRQHTYEAQGYRVTWELHTEFVTLTWMSPRMEGETWPAGIGLEVLSDYALMVATRIDLLPVAEIPQHLIPTFNIASLCVSNIEGGKGQIATDLVPDKDGFTRIEFATGSIIDVRRGVVVRRMLEIETYRVFALLGLPLARELSGQLTSAESELSRQLEVMGAVDTVEEAHASLDTLHSLSVKTGQLAEKTGYRFAASFAYGDVLDLRLERLAEQSVGYASTLQRYLDNRIAPALATCRAFEKRQAALASKLDRAIGLLNTRIGLDMQMQNRALLGRLTETAQSQFRLQSTVEGLSTIAISYYALGILSYILTGAGEVAHFSKALTVALAAPVVVLLVWLGLRWVQRRHH
jgi:uncharacterized membrane-anchored protein